MLRVPRGSTAARRRPHSEPRNGPQTARRLGQVSQHAHNRCSPHVPLCVHELPDAEEKSLEILRTLCRTRTGDPFLTINARRVACCCALCQIPCKSAFRPGRPRSLLPGVAVQRFLGASMACSSSALAWLAAAPSGSQRHRLLERRSREAYKVVRMISEAYDAKTAKAWLVGTNSRLERPRRSGHLRCRLATGADPRSRTSSGARTVARSPRCRRGRRWLAVHQLAATSLWY
jgi:hypothetical protein